jgi:hypothetical protein
MQSRYGHALLLYKQYLIVYGGGGKQDGKMRGGKVTFSDIRIFDMRQNIWIENDFARDGG